MRNFLLNPLILWLGLTGNCSATELEWVRVADDNRSFVLEKSAQQFVPWGFNYDHQEGSGRLVEDYWDEEWTTVEEDWMDATDLKRLAVWLDEQRRGGPM